MDFLRAQVADEREAVEFRQHAIDDQNIVGFIAGTGVAVKAVADIIGDMTGLAKCLDHVIGGFGIVFDDEDAHKRHIAHPCAKQQAGSCLPACRLLEAGAATGGRGTGP